jgi:hypothetical protein
VVEKHDWPPSALATGECVSVREHLEAIADTTARYEALLRLAEEKLHTERDRRYSEVNIEKEKALKIKETADLAALQLARDIQIYKDEKANMLREQINSERGLYPTKSDLIAAVEKLEMMIYPLQEAKQLTQGKGSGIAQAGAGIYTIIIASAAVAGIVATAINLMHQH